MYIILMYLTFQLILKSSVFRAFLSSLVPFLNGSSLKRYAT